MICRGGNKYINLQANTSKQVILIRCFQILVWLQFLEQSYLLLITLAIMIKSTNQILKLNSGTRMYLQVPQIVHYSCESIHLSFTIFVIFIFAKTKCPSKVRFAQTNRLNGQKLSDVRLFPPLIWLDEVIWEYEVTCVLIPVVRRETLYHDEPVVLETLS